MYEASQDSYCYKGSDVLKNKAGLRSQEALDEFEAVMTFARADEPLPSGSFSLSHYYAVHRHLFQDVYTWAGKPRTVRLAKGASAFCYPEYIDQEITRVFAGLKSQRNLRGLEPKEFAEGAAHFLADLNAIHPFREGNGRAQTTFIAMLAASAGHHMNLERLNPKRTLAAMIASFNGDEAPLSALISDLIF